MNIVLMKSNTNVELFTGYILIFFLYEAEIFFIGQPLSALSHQSLLLVGGGGFCYNQEIISISSFGTREVSFLVIIMRKCEFCRQTLMSNDEGSLCVGLFIIKDNDHFLRGLGFSESLNS